MRKKSHISLSHYLLQDMKEKTDLLRLHRKSFYIGSIMPDLTPSFLYRKHNIDATYYLVKSEIQKIADNYNKTQKAGYYFWMRLGIITHYLADYCTFPHNSIFSGTLAEHCHYENNLKFALRTYIRESIHNKPAQMLPVVQSTDDIFQMIEKLHQNYLKAVKIVEEDCAYIIDMCRRVVSAIFELIIQKPAVLCLVKAA